MYVGGSERYGGGGAHKSGSKSFTERVEERYL